MKEREILKMIEMFTRETAIRICIVCEETRVAKQYCRIPKCDRKDFEAWKSIVSTAIHEVIWSKSRILMRARATGKNEITLYFDEGEGEDV